MADARSDKPRILSAATAVPPHRVEQGRSRSSPAGSSRGAQGHLGPGARLLCRARPLPVLVMSVALLRRLRSVQEVN
jgi:hypothetical protein